MAERTAIVDALGRPVRLGRRIGQGGEGTVFEIESEGGTAAKIYHRPMTRHRADKIRTMVAMRTAAIDRWTAWPLELLTSPSGEAIGVKVPRLDGYKDIHLLYSPKSRRTDFKGADWRFLLAVAANLARSFAAIHGMSGVVIADVNHSGVLVDQEGRVRLIDCDGFQISRGSQNYLCELGVAIFTPPELQNQSLAGAVRTANHDNFGLAVLVFLLLFMGRHPYAGRYGGSGEMPMEAAIQQHRFAYGAHRTVALMEPPPGARHPCTSSRRRSRSSSSAPSRATAHRAPDPLQANGSQRWNGSSAKSVGARRVRRIGILPGCPTARGAGWRPQRECRYSRRACRR